MNSFTSLVLAPHHLWRATWLFFTLWTLAIAASVVWNTHLLREAMFEAAVTDARGDFDTNVLYRRWATLHGGVYVPVTARTPPNPYLTNVVERDLVTPSGRRLTLMNPDYMTRQVHELETRELGRHSHITSLKPLRPEDAPDGWEAAGLRAFEQGRTEVNSRETLNGQPYLRLMKPLVTEAGCLKCHAAQGHHAGELLGGISVTVPLDPYLALARLRTTHIALVHAGLWALGALAIFLAARQMRQRLDQQLQAEAALLESRQHLRELFDEAPVGYHELDEAGRIIQVNATELKMLGYSAAEMLGQPVWTFVEDSESSRQAVLAKLGGHTPSTQACERVYRCKDGTTLPVFIEDRMIKSPDGRVLCIRSTLQNVTERKRAEEALRASQQVIEGILNAMPARVFWKDKNLVFLGCNAAFARDAGFADPQDIIGKDDYQMGWREQAELYRGDDRQVIESGCSKLLIEEPQTTPEGNTITILSSKIPLRGSNGEISGVLGIYMDITARKQTEAERDQLIQDLQKALANVKSLSGLLPICAGCKQIRDDKGYWSQVESYIQRHSEATFTHGLCPDCIKKYYPDLDEK